MNRVALAVFVSSVPRSAMGNSEKVVILLILLVCAVVLGISLRPAEGIRPLDSGDAEEVQEEGLRSWSEPGTREPEAGSDERGERTLPGQFLDAGPAVAITDGIEYGAGTRTDALLFSLSQEAGERKVALIRTDGLVETPHPDFLHYTLRAGDDWLTLAEHFYGDAGRADLLREANEDTQSLAPGKQVLVPVFDLIVEGLDRERVEPREELPYRVYVVESGDSLTSISQAMYGTKARWMQIFDANRDLLEDPDTLVVGSKLRIPH